MPVLQCGVARNAYHLSYRPEDRAGAATQGNCQLTVGALYSDQYTPKADLISKIMNTMHVHLWPGCTLGEHANGTLAGNQWTIAADGTYIFFLVSLTCMKSRNNHHTKPCKLQHQQQSNA